MDVLLRNGCRNDPSHYAFGCRDLDPICSICVLSKGAREYSETQEWEELREVQAVYYTSHGNGSLTRVPDPSATEGTDEVHTRSYTSNPRSVKSRHFRPATVKIIPLQGIPPDRYRLQDKRLILFVRQVSSRRRSRLSHARAATTY